MAEVEVTGGDLSGFVNNLMPLITTVMNLMVMFMMLKMVFGLLERIMPAGGGL